MDKILYKIYFLNYRLLTLQDETCINEQIKYCTLFWWRVFLFINVHETQTRENKSAKGQKNI